MASANVDLARSILAAWERGDWSSADWAHPEIEFVRTGGPTGGSWKGLAGMAQGWRDFLSSWQDLRIVGPEEYRELDDERVLVLHDFRGRGKTSGLDLGQMQSKVATLFHIRDGKVTRLVAYSHRNVALADLGLPREAGSPGP
ncbi:MAG TPA: nuclear transport factor 2 family protein [Solirubrobacteraceae bacterium]|nr:nuclear transport factor 2 family protein [Solirubrobacteraceae bacterium]